jgi:hypothetical protein
VSSSSSWQASYAWAQCRASRSAYDMTISISAAECEYLAMMQNVACCFYIIVLWPHLLLICSSNISLYSTARLGHLGGHIWRWLAGNDPSGWPHEILRRWDSRWRGDWWQGQQTRDLDFSGKIEG